MSHINDNFDPNEPQHRFWFGLAPRDWLLILFSWPYMTGIFCLISHELFGKPGQFSFVLMAGSAFLASFVVALEIRTVVIPSHWIGGRKFLDLGGLTLKASGGERWKIACAIVIRLIMAGVFSLVTAICVSSIFFRPDLDTFFAKQAAQQNTHLADGAGERIDTEVADKRAALADAMKRDRLLSDQVGRLRGKVAAGRARKDLSIQLPALEAQLGREDAAIAKLRNEIDRLTAGRTDTINRDVESSPSYARVPHGLLADVEGLEALARADPHAKAVMLTFEALFLAFELGLVMATMTDTAPSPAAGAWVYRLYTLARALARKATTEVEADDSDTPPPPPDDDATPPANDNGVPPFAAPVFGELVAGGARNGFGDQPPPGPPRRPRGRPRKNPLN